MLTSKIFGRLVVYVSILLGILLIQYCEGQTWAGFRNKHVDYPKTGAANPNAYCNLMMRRRNLIQRPCKFTNTFINYSAGRIRQLCQRIRRGYVTSPQSYPVVKCNRQSNTQYPNCQYTGRPQNKKIKVLCDRYVPVHLGGLV